MCARVCARAAVITALEDKMRLLTNRVGIFQPVSHYIVGFKIGSKVGTD